MATLCISGNGLSLITLKAQWANLACQTSLYNLRTHERFAADLRHLEIVHGIRFARFHAKFALNSPFNSPGLLIVAASS